MGDSEIDLLAHKRTRYFQIKRTQPFFITFVQAIIAFKRVAKTMKLVFARRNMKKEKTVKNSMKQISRISTQNVINALHGQPVISLTTEEMAEHRYLKSMRKTRNDKENCGTIPSLGGAAAVTSPMPDVKTGGAHPAGAASYGTKGGLPLNMAERLRKRLNTAPTEAMMKSLEKSHALPINEKTGSMIAAGISQLQVKNSTIQDSEAKQHREYVSGTVIYYGSSIAVQARHGGYLSFHDPKNIKASAHKIMQHSRFIVSSADDAAFGGAIKFGDAIMLQAGQHEVLGAQFQGGPDENTTTRKIKPSLINFRQGNSGRAQNYGRWIICSKIEPEKRMGTAVCHFDKILLEQEWYFLGSSSPYDASMVKHSNFEEALDRTNKTSRNKANQLFHPREECTWKFVLVTLPTDKNEDERNREYMMQDAAMRILQSEERRWKTRELLMDNMVNSLPEHLKLTEVAKNQLSHKNNPIDEQEALYDKYEQIAQKEFKPDSHSVHRLAKIYGADSDIIKHTLRAREVREHALGGSTRRVDDEFQADKIMKKTTEPFSLRLAKKEYWDCANKLLIDSRVYESMPSFMEKYRQKDAETKFKAGLVILRYLSRRKKRMKSTFVYSNEMRLIDLAEDKRLGKKKRDDAAQAAYQDLKAKAAADKIRSIAASASTKAAQDLKIQERLHTVNQDQIQKLTRNLSIRNATRVGSASCPHRRPSSAPTKGRVSVSIIAEAAKIKGLPNSNMNEHIPRNPSAIAAFQLLEADKKRTGIANSVVRAQNAILQKFQEFAPSDAAIAEAADLQRQSDAEEAEAEHIKVEKSHVSEGEDEEAKLGLRGSASESVLKSSDPAFLSSFSPPKPIARPQTASAAEHVGGVAMPRIEEENGRSRSHHHNRHHHAPSFSHDRAAANKHPPRPHTANPIGSNRDVPSIEIPESPVAKPPVHARALCISVDIEDPGKKKEQRRVLSFMPSSPFDVKKFYRPEMTSKDYHTGWTPTKPEQVVESPLPLYTPDGPPSTHFSRRACSLNVFAAPLSYSDNDSAKMSGNDKLSKSLEHVTQFRRQCTRNKDRLQRSATKLHGLPSDVMKHQQKAVTIDTTVKFLRAASKNPHLYDDIKVKNKRTCGGCGSGVAF